MVLAIPSTSSFFSTTDDGDGGGGGGGGGTDNSVVGSGGGGGGGGVAIDCVDFACIVATLFLSTSAILFELVDNFVFSLQVRSSFSTSFRLLERRLLLFDDDDDAPSP